MILYHFTSGRFVDSIKQTGLNLGMLPVITDNGYTHLVKHCQWLTKDPNWVRQSWATKQLIDYDRTEYRLKILIPRKHHDKLCKATNILDILPHQSQKLISDWEGSKNWYLFLGNIPGSWIRKITKKGALI